MRGLRRKLNVAGPQLSGVSAVKPPLGRAISKLGITGSGEAFAIAMKRPSNGISAYVRSILPSASRRFARRSRMRANSSFTGSMSISGSRAPSTRR